MSYSQRDEEQYILKYFEGKTGKFLDIGAFHPFVFSTVRGLYEVGWKGTLIEPAESNFPFIRETYKDDTEIEVLQTCVGMFDGEIPFFDSNGDAISSTNKEHKEKWEKGYGSIFREYISPVCTFQTLITKTKYRQYDFINLDVEGTNWEILQTIDPYLVGCKMVCVEFDNKKNEIDSYMTSRNFYKLHETAENLIYVL